MSESMRKLLNIMPEEARILVQKEGGLRDFLAISSLFTIEEDIVTNFEDKLITDLSKPYKKPQDPPVITRKENGAIEKIGTLEKIPDSFSSNTATVQFGPVGSLLANVGDTLPQNKSLANVGDTLPQNKSLANVDDTLPQNKSLANVGDTLPQNKSLANVGDTLPQNKSLANVGDTLQLNNNSKIHFPLPNFTGAPSLENLGNHGSVHKENVNSSAMTDTWSAQGSSLDKWTNGKEFVPSQKDVNIVNTAEISNKNTVSVATGGNELGEIEVKSMKDMNTKTAREIADSSTNDLHKEINENINKILSDDSPDDVDDLVNESTDNGTKTIENTSGVMEVKEDDSDVKSSVEKIFSRPSTNLALIDESVLKKESEEPVNIKITNSEPAASALSDQDVTICQNKNDKKTNEQNEPILNSVPNSATKDTAVFMEPKLTKEKGVQSKPSTKTKIIMTEPMNEPYKAEYEKLLRSCQGWQNKYQELLDKNIQMERRYGLDVVNLEKKLKECGHKMEVSFSLLCNI
jgi:hypothetical protein